MGDQEPGRVDHLPGLREERYRWREERNQGAVSDAGDEAVMFGDWSYTGIAYTDEGEELLARAMAESRRRSRRIAREER